MNVLREFWPEIRHPRRRLNEARAQAMAQAIEPEVETRAEIEVVELDAGTVWNALRRTQATDDSRPS
jgi:hypothetical protein